MAMEEEGKWFYRLFIKLLQKTSKAPTNTTAPHEQLTVNLKRCLNLTRFQMHSILSQTNFKKEVLECFIISLQIEAQK